MRKRMAARLRNTSAYAFAKSLRGCFREIRKTSLAKVPDRRVISLNPEGPSRGKVLFSYIIDGFLLKPGDPLPNRHTNIWQSLKMADTFVELGYSVDVISWKNETFVPEGDYSAFVDVRRNLERIAPILNQDCVKIAHFDTAHILFHNAAEARRLLELQERRGITLQPRRFELPNLGIEHADFATISGNDFTGNTFQYANKPIYKLPSPCAVSLDWKNKDWEACRRRFLWFSSGGFVHKGLDLVLDAFSELPDYHLIVCGPIDREKDFARAYYKELYETPNIKTLGWVDVEGESFRDIAATCSTSIHMSCSEGGGASVKMCMHAGLIPIVSYESSVDVDGFGYTLNNCSVGNIQNMVRNVVALPSGEIKNRSRLAWEFATRHHTRKNFAREYRRVISEILLK